MLGKKIVKTKKITSFLIERAISIFRYLISRYACPCEDGNTLGLDVGAADLRDVATGRVLYEYNADELLGVASMSKMLTEYLVLEAIAEGTISWDDQVLINE